MRHFAAAKAQGDFDLVALLEKLQNRAHFDIIDMRICPRTELDRFNLDDVLLFAGLGLTLLLLILVFAKIHDLANRRFCGGRNLYQI